MHSVDSPTGNGGSSISSPGSLRFLMSTDHGYSGIALFARDLRNSRSSFGPKFDAPRERGRKPRTFRGESPGVFHFSMSFLRSATAWAKGVPTDRQHGLRQFAQCGTRSLPSRITASWKPAAHPHDGHHGMYEWRASSRNSFPFAPGVSETVIREPADPPGDKHPSTGRALVTMRGLPFSGIVEWQVYC